MYKGMCMNRTSKLIAGAVLCVGLVHVASARKTNNINVRVVKENPKEVLEYAIKTDKGISKYKKFEGLDTTIKFDDNSSIKELYIKKLGESNAAAIAFPLMRKRDQMNQGLGLILIDGGGIPRYTTQAGLENSQNKMTPLYNQEEVKPMAN